MGKTRNKIKVSSVKNSEILELQKINHEGQMVLTINQICQIYDIKKYNVYNRFYMNKESFVEGKHYFKVGTLNINIFTQKGVGRLTSLIGGNQALKIYKKLEENYFNQEDEKVNNVQSKELTVVEANENSGLRALHFLHIHFISHPPSLPRPFPSLVF